MEWEARVEHMVRQLEAAAKEDPASFGNAFVCRAAIDVVDGEKDDSSSLVDQEGGARWHIYRSWCRLHAKRQFRRFPDLKKLDLGMGEDWENKALVMVDNVTEMLVMMLLLNREWHGVIRDYAPMLCGGDNAAERRWQWLASLDTGG
eukprot:gene50282-1842_t